MTHSVLVERASQLTLLLPLQSASPLTLLVPLPGGSHVSRRCGVSVRDLQIVPCSMEAAREFVAEHHRHHLPAEWHRFSVAVEDREGVRHGVAVVNNPVARALQDGYTLEVTRLATDGTTNACSMLYGACWRAATAMGFRRLITYTLPTESGASLKASGWTCVGLVRPRDWNAPGRQRSGAPKAMYRLRWEKMRASL
jgi:hypothetical protein